jgi:hypothetical protein
MTFPAKEIKASNETEVNKPHQTDRNEKGRSPNVSLIHSARRARFQITCALFDYSLQNSMAQQKA